MSSNHPSRDSNSQRSRPSPSRLLTTTTSQPPRGDNYPASSQLTGSDYHRGTLLGVSSINAPRPPPQLGRGLGITEPRYYQGARSQPERSYRGTSTITSGHGESSYSSAQEQQPGLAGDTAPQPSDRTQRRSHPEIPPQPSQSIYIKQERPGGPRQQDPLQPYAYQRIGFHEEDPSAADRPQPVQEEFEMEYPGVRPKTLSKDDAP